MRQQINNFTNVHALTVSTSESALAIQYGGFVEIGQRAGSVVLQHTMTIEQALQMAEALTAAAAEEKAWIAGQREAA